MPKHLSQGKHDKQAQLLGRRGAKITSLLGYAILPRPYDFLLKGTVFWFSLMLADLALAVEFRTSLPLQAILVFVCLDFLAKQATYIWNDINDIERDSHHSVKSQRCLARLGCKHFGEAMFYTRTAVAVLASLTLGVVFDLPWLPPLIAFVFVWQLVYDRWAKPRGRWRLVIASLGYAERSAAGVLVVVPYPDGEGRTLLVLVMVWAVLLALLFLAAYWFAEAEHELRCADREWFRKEARYWQSIANGLLFPVGAIIGLRYSSDSVGVPLAVGGAISVLGVAVVLLQRVAVRRERRRASLVLVVAIGILSWVVCPPSLRLLVPAVGFPLYVGIMFCNLEFEETLMSDPFGHRR